MTGVTVAAGSLLHFHPIFELASFIVTGEEESDATVRS